MARESNNYAPKGHTSVIPQSHGTPDPTILDHFGWTKETKPEKRLLLAVIEQAWKDLTGPDPVMREDAHLWLHSYQEKREWSLGWVCAHLEIDAAYIRRKVSEVTKSGKLKRVRVHNRVIARLEG